MPEAADRDRRAELRSWRALMRRGFRMGTISAKDVVAKRQVGLEQLAPAAGTTASREENEEVLVLLSEARRKVLAGDREDALWRVVEAAGRLCQEFPRNPTARMVAGRYPKLTLSFSTEPAWQLRLDI
jgi:hypothetical protein